jgi:glycosyltransferase involved in cell wall biosynthesis
MEQARMTDHLARIEQYVDKVEDWEQLPDEPLVSVCITTYNHEDFIADAIEGALMQETDFPYEIIIAEDNSTDATGDIVLDYQRRYPGRIRLRLAEENLYSKCRRYPIWGLHGASRGKYIAQCEGDDYWTGAKKLQRQIDVLEANPDFAGSFHETKDVDYESGEVVEVRAENTPDTISAEDTISRGTHFHTSSFVYRQDAVEWPEWSPEFVSGDMILFSVVAASGDLMKVDRIMSVRRNHNESLTKTSEQKSGFHDRRIRLMKSLNRWHGDEFDSKLKSVISFHKRKGPSLLDRLRMKLGIRTRIRRIMNCLYKEYNVG